MTRICIPAFIALAGLFGAGYGDPPAPPPAGGSLPRTPVEAEGGGRPTLPGEALRFLRQVAAYASGWDLHELAVGDDAGDRLTVPLVVWPSANQGPGERLTILLMAGLHGDEPSGSDALLALARDLAQERHADWGAKARFLILPMVNPQGLGQGVRNTDRDIDLNRDHLRLRAAETRLVHGLYARWLPDATMDLHEKPEACRHVELARATHPSEEPRRRALARDLLRGAAVLLAKDGLPSHPFFTRSFAQEKGTRPARLSAFYHPALPDPEDSLNGFSVKGSLSFFSETASGTPDRPYADIVADQTKVLNAMIASILEQADRVREVVALARSGPARADAPLQMRLAPDPADPAPAFSACAEITDWRKGIHPWLPRVEITLKRPRPAAYLLPARFAEAASVLLGHGITVYRAVRSFEIAAMVPVITGSGPSPPEGPERPLFKAEFVNKTLQVEPGDWMIPVIPPMIDLLPILLEPESQYGLGRYVELGLAPEVGRNYPVARLPVVPPLADFERLSLSAGGAVSESVSSSQSDIALENRSR